MSDRLLIGVGNDWRRDDGAGPAVAERLRGVAGWDVLVVAGDGSAIMEAWRGRGRVVVVDAMRSTLPPGTVRRFDAARRPLPNTTFPSLSHRFGLAEAVEMARLLGRLPGTLIIFGIEAADIGHGQGLSAEVAAAVATVTDAIVAGGVFEEADFDEDCRSGGTTV